MTKAKSPAALRIRIGGALLLAGFAAALAPLAGAAAPFPNGQPITLVVPYPPGGSNDSFARAVGAKLGALLDTSVVIVNKGGAGGSIGAAQVARAKPDGYTLAAVSSSFTTNAAIQGDLPFDAEKDFKAVALMAKGPFIVAVKQGLPAKSMADLIALAKKAPGAINYSSSGPGSSNQFATEMLNSAAGIKMTHIPYRGMGPATAALMGDQVDVLVASGPSLLPAINTGKARAIAITSLEPSPIAPDLKPVADAVPGYEFSLWWGILAPAGTPDAIVDKLNEAVQQVVTTPEMKAFFVREGAEFATASARDYQKIIKDDIVRWKKVAAESHITVQK
ncbi:tripartite tricarboxylate transporter substrate-binding protein [Pollutimonas bauzanensis]|uniref:Tripartite-type tricarboxylate transporter, receptor component TctC n=1 Tax=Pollutimonas bauzanensis TaxID=658167 RepID=A0A1M5ZYP4_9BURK|nr:tripartite tricarboxylate transporter substrate-binding protein [Pollutimonas bauzanensis]SHI29013.1 Tripartite-type tricarboxylate transporter, receptor component TctC [Pollutimonas bauzanensis]